MNLKGSLDAFGLPDVFALLAMTAKSGALRLHRTGNVRRDGIVWFHEGRVTGASANCARQGLVRRLVGSGTVSDDALEAAVRSAASGTIGVARALVEAGAVEGDLVREAAVDQAVDAVFDLGRWDDGEFGFEPGATNIDDVGLALEHSWLIAEATSRRAAWDELREAIPGDDPRLALPVAVDEDPTVTREEWALLAMIDGHRSVSDLVELTGAGEFAVTTVLAGLARRGLLTVVGETDGDHATTVVRRLRLLAQAEQLDVDATAPVDEPAVAEADPDEPETAPEPEPKAPVVDEAAAALAAPVLAARPTGPMSAADALAAARAAQSQAAASQAAHGQSAGASGERPVARQTVVPARPEPYLPGRQVDHPESAAAGAYQGPSGGGHLTPTAGATAMVPAPGPAEQGIIERDPAVNRSLLLRLIAGVRGL